MASLITGDREVADDLAADALAEIWRYWDRVNAAPDPLAYARGILVNVARSWNRRHGLEQRGARLAALFRRDHATTEADVPSALDVRAALRRLPYRRRACVVLRYAFDLSEREVAEILGITVGTVKSQTSRGSAQLAGLLAGVDATPPGASDSAARPGRGPVDPRIALARSSLASTEQRRGATGGMR
ncbi:SigE family RNA polymerase sigma factor [Cryptosporangium minutisporangium]|uniref:SigE family RNA polymerase sigma factor n=2 Tax=Cryptosporangium minutisporangium TaxID=113569 RepID=A0ABP6T855_9ACTN